MSRQNLRHGLRFRIHFNNFCRQRWCVWELANFEDGPPPEAMVSLLEATSFWGVAPLVMRAQSLGIPSVLEDSWGPGCCGLECCLEPKVLGITSQCGGIGLISCQTYRSVRYRIDVVPTLPQCPVTVSVLYRYRYRVRYIRAYRYRVHAGTACIPAPRVYRCRLCRY